MTAALAAALAARQADALSAPAAGPRLRVPTWEPRRRGSRLRQARRS